MKNTQNICFVEGIGQNSDPANTAGNLGLGANSHCNVEFTKKGRQTARTFVAAGIADPTPGCAGAKKNPFYGSAGLLRAERRAGEMLRETEKHPGGQPYQENPTGIMIKPVETLDDLGISRTHGSADPGYSAAATGVPKLGMPSSAEGYPTASVDPGIKVASCNHDRPTSVPGKLHRIANLPCYVTYIESQSYQSMYSQTRGETMLNATELDDYRRRYQCRAVRGE